MTAFAIVFFGAVFCVSVCIGAIMALLLRAHPRIAAVITFATAIVFFGLLEWRLGSPNEWSWGDPITSLAYLIGPFMLFCGGPALVTAFLLGDRLKRRKVI